MIGNEPQWSRTRTRLIDPQLRQAEWRLDDKSQVRFEIPVDGYDAEPRARVVWELRLCYNARNVIVQAICAYGKTPKKGFIMTPDQVEAKVIELLGSPNNCKLPPVAQSCSVFKARSRPRR